MLFPQFSDNPFQINLCFHKIIERLEDIAAKNAGADSVKAKQLLEEIELLVEKDFDGKYFIHSSEDELGTSEFTIEEMKLIKKLIYICYIFNT